jgi:hypothetical protein
MANWILAALSPVLCIGPTVAVAQRGRGQSRAAARSLPAALHLAPDLEAAERQLGLLLRRMRAYRRAPYDCARSRIRNDAEFEGCLDLATALGLRIGELSGAPMAAPRERERIRDQIVEGLSARPTSSAVVWTADRADRRRSAP